jgi:hypothetical protein
VGSDGNQLLSHTNTIGIKLNTSQGITKICYFAVSHKDPGSMDQCWLNPSNMGGSTPYVRIKPEFYGRRSRRTNPNAHEETVNYDSPEDLLCIFRGEVAASSVLDSSRGLSPSMMLEP